MHAVEALRPDPLRDGALLVGERPVQRAHRDVQLRRDGGHGEPRVAQGVEHILVAGLSSLRAAEPSTAARAAQARAVARRRLRDPGLTVAAIAAELHVSVSTLHRAFADQQCTIAEWIWAQRLDGYKLLGLPETGINVDHTPGPRGPVTYGDLSLRQFVVLPPAPPGP